MKRTNRIISLLLIAALALSPAGCGEKNTPASGSSLTWIDSNLFENIDKMGQANIKDDFSAAVNYEWASVQEKDFSIGIGAAAEAQKTVLKNQRALISDESVQGKNIELVRIVDGLYSDKAYRDSLGVEPLKKYMGYIDSVKTIDDLSSYMIDNEKNPFAAALVGFNYANNDALDNYRALNIQNAALSLENPEYYFDFTMKAAIQKDRVESRIKYIFGRLGYTDKEIKKVISGCFRFESELARVDVDKIVKASGSVFTKAEVLEMAGSYPFEEMLKHYSITECDHYTGYVYYLESLKKIYTPKNVEYMKDYFKVRLALDSFKYLDTAAYDFYMNSEVDRTDPFSERNNTDPDYDFFQELRATPLTAAMDQVYLDRYYNENTYKDICGFLDKIKAKYHTLIDANDNLSGKSKEAVKSKLDNMGRNVFTPSNKADFTGVELRSKEEGGSYLDALCVLNKFSYEHIGEMVQKEVPRTYWDIYDSHLSTTRVEAFYNLPQNCIYILAGIMTAPMYSEDYTIEQKLGNFVALLGHEVSHAFDDTGINRDAQGKFNQILTKEELSFWSDKVTQIKDHFEGYQPFEGSAVYHNASYLSDEVIADTEGVRVALLIAKDYENFDYDKFFRSYAALWRKLNTKNADNEKIKTNSHPLHYIRANYTLRQFDEFIETYGIKPGDGMYLDPKERVIIW